MPPLAPETAEAAARDCAEGTEEGGMCVWGPGFWEEEEGEGEEG